MKIKTITCHDVYNVGASLQAFALQKYLSSLGHDVEIIDYKPDYLSRHYSLTAVNNVNYDKPFLRELYILSKLYKRVKALKSEKKKAFDAFTNQYLKLTKKRYHSYAELLKDCPEADLYIAGSDQIWNPLFPNGKDPSFFLDFIPEDKIKASYAASFAVEKIEKDDQIRMKRFLDKFDYISVREISAINILNTMNLTGTHVCDPVFLLGADEWKKILVPFEHDKKYIFVYDFDSNKAIHQRIRDYAKENNLDIISVFPHEGEISIDNLGPLEFLGIIAGAELVVSNSFHATAFALLFHIPFFVFFRKENINIRMYDLLSFFLITDRIISFDTKIRKNWKDLDWYQIDRAVKNYVKLSKEYLEKCLSQTEVVHE